MQKRDDGRRAPEEELLVSFPLTVETTCRLDYPRKDLVAPIVLPKYTKADLAVHRKHGFILPPHVIQGQVSTKPQFTFNMPDLRMMANAIREFRDDEFFQRTTDGPSDTEFDEELLSEALIDMLRKATFILEEAHSVNHAEMKLSDFQESMRKAFRDDKRFDRMCNPVCEKIHAHWCMRRVTQASGDPAVHFPRVNDYTSTAPPKEIYNVPFVQREGLEFTKLHRIQKTTSVPHYMAKQQATLAKTQLLEEFIQKIARLREFLDLIDVREREKRRLSLEDMYILARARSAFE